MLAYIVAVSGSTLTIPRPFTVIPSVLSANAVTLIPNTITAASNKLIAVLKLFFIVITPLYIKMLSK